MVVPLWQYVCDTWWVANDNRPNKNIYKSSAPAPSSDIVAKTSETIACYHLKCGTLHKIITKNHLWNMHDVLCVVAIPPSCLPTSPSSILTWHKHHFTNTFCILATKSRTRITLLSLFVLNDNNLHSVVAKYIQWSAGRRYSLLCLQKNHTVHTAPVATHPLWFMHGERTRSLKMMCVRFVSYFITLRAPRKIRVERDLIQTIRR